jgi:hypothetical protein
MGWTEYRILSNWASKTACKSLIRGIPKTAVLWNFVQVDGPFLASGLTRPTANVSLSGYLDVRTISSRSLITKANRAVARLRSWRTRSVVSSGWRDYYAIFVEPLTSLSSSKLSGTRAHWLISSGSFRTTVEKLSGGADDRQPFDLVERRQISLLPRDRGARAEYFPATPKVALVACEAESCEAGLSILPGYRSGACRY